MDLSQKACHGPCQDIAGAAGCHAFIARRIHKEFTVWQGNQRRRAFKDNNGIPSFGT